MKLEKIKNMDERMYVELAMKKRWSAKKLEEESQKLIEEANIILLRILPTLKEEIVEDKQLGIVMIVRQSRTNFDRSKARDELANKGVDIKIIKDAFSAATTKQNSTSVRFDLLEEKK